MAAAATVSTANANDLNFMAFGDQLAGGRLTIDWMPGPGAGVITLTAPIFAVGPGHGRAILPDPFGNPFPGAIFDMIGDSSVGDWRLENLADATIISATFDLNGSISLFDDDSNPSTPGSAAGLNDVQFNAVLSTAPQEIGANEFGPWLQAKNTGDMFHQETILWPLPTLQDPFFTFGLVYYWFDDTDVVPAPGAAILLGLGGLMAARRRRC
jgi:hypothetical protein